MHSDIYSFYSEIIELNEKPVIPIGEMGTNVEGESYNFDQSKIRETSYRAIIDLGLLDADKGHLEFTDKSLKFAGASPDMIVIDLGDDKKNYKVGDLIKIKIDYMGALRIINSKICRKKRGITVGN